MPCRSTESACARTSASCSPDQELDAAMLGGHVQPPSSDAPNRFGIEEQTSLGGLDHVVFGLGPGHDVYGQWRGAIRLLRDSQAGCGIERRMRSHALDDDEGLRCDSGHLFGRLLWVSWCRLAAAALHLDPDTDRAGRQPLGTN